MSGQIVYDPLIVHLFEHYQISKMGAGGMGFNWETGSWGDMPRQAVEALLIIDSEVNRIQNAKQPRTHPHH